MNTLASRHFWFVSMWLAASALITQPVFAQTVNNIVMTENSSTSLGVTYNGSTSGITVSNTSPDQWFIVLPSQVSLDGSGSSTGWIEPENPNRWNFMGLSGGHEFTMQSDIPVRGNGAPNGTTIPNLGQDTSNGGSISATYYDNATATESVPEPPSSLLIVVAFIAVFIARRFRINILHPPDLDSRITALRPPVCSQISQACAPT